MTVRHSLPSPRKLGNSMPPFGNSPEAPEDQPLARSRSSSSSRSETPPYSPRRPSSSHPPDIDRVDDDVIYQTASDALRQGSRHVEEGVRGATVVVKPMSCAKHWANAGWTALKYIVPLSFGAAAYGMTLEADPETSILAASTAFTLVNLAFSSRFNREEFKETVRIGFTQLASQVTSGLSIKFGLEQISNIVDPTLHSVGAFNGTHYAGSASELVGNASEAYGIDHERLFPGGTAWLSLAVVGIPAAVQLLCFLVKVPHGTTSADAFVNQLRLDASGVPGGGKVRARWSDREDMVIRNGAKLGVFAAGMALVGGLLATGQRKLAMRILSNANQVQLAARTRDFMNMLMRGVTSGGPESERWANTGFRRQQQIKIPAPVMTALTELCTDPETGSVDQDRLDRSTQQLRTWYRNLFVASRASSQPIYTLTSALGLFFMRSYFAPSIGATYPVDIREAFSVLLPVSVGTSITEASEESAWAKMLGLWSDVYTMPFEIARAPTDPTAKFTSNLDQLSFTSLIPGHTLIRSVATSRYLESTVKDGNVALSLADRVELNSGIRIGQNLVTMVLLTTAGAALPESKTTFYVLAVLVNGATHWRGNVVAQILDSGREAELLFREQEAAAVAASTTAVEEVSADDGDRESDDSNSPLTVTILHDSLTKPVSRRASQQQFDVSDESVIGDEDRNSGTEEIRIPGDYPDFDPGDHDPIVVPDAGNPADASLEEPVLH